MLYTISDITGGLLEYLVDHYFPNTFIQTIIRIRKNVNNAIQHSLFLVFQVYKKLGEIHLAQMHFSWAVDLDPKGANNQIKEAVDKRYLPDDDDVGIDDADLMGSSVETGDETNSDIDPPE